MRLAGIFMPWFGPAPGWERQFIERSLAIESLVPILVGDAAEFAPDLDVPRVHCTMDEYEARASKAAGVRISKHDPGYSRGQALCELRPLMADMYPEQIAGLPWWGYGDWDVVWGDWDSFFANTDLSDYDVVSTNAKTINGPLTFYRNKPEIVTLYRKRMDLVKCPHSHWLDESGMQEIVAAQSWVCVLYLRNLNGHDRDTVWNRCTLRDGKLFRMDQDGKVDGEILKFHFPLRGLWPLETVQEP